MKPKKYHGWKKGDRFYISLKPQDDKWPAMDFASPMAALAVAAGRGLPLEWEDREEIDKWHQQST
jgi:hypothetical protein